MTKAHGATPAVSALRAAGVAYQEHAYSHDPRAESFGDEAAHALGVDPGLVLKTLVLTLDPSALAVVVLPVDSRVDLKAAARAFGAKKAALADPSVAQRATGYVVGGISPVGQRRRLKTVVDAGAADHARVYVSGGRRGLDLEIDPRDLIRITGAVVDTVARR